MKKVRDVLLKSNLFGGLPKNQIEHIEKISVNKYLLILFGTPLIALYEAITD